MRIGELAEQSGLTAKTLRFYEQAGVLPEPGREKSGYRDYDQGAVGRLAFVKAAQTAGLTLSEIRQVIVVREQEGAPCSHVVALLDEHAAKLARRIVELTALREQVLRLRERSKDLDPARCSATTVCDIIPGPNATAPSQRVRHVSAESGGPGVSSSSPL